MIEDLAMAVASIARDAVNAAVAHHNNTPMNPTPQRIQLSRRAGFKLQEVSMALNGLPCVKCDRTTRFGNYCAQPGMTNTEAVEAFKRGLDKPHSKLREIAKAELRGKNLACWCPLLDKGGHPAHCHCNVLLAIANEDS